MFKEYLEGINKIIVNLIDNNISKGYVDFKKIIYQIKEGFILFIKKMPNVLK